MIGRHECLQCSLFSYLNIVFKSATMLSGLNFSNLISSIIISRLLLCISVDLSETTNSLKLKVDLFSQYFLLWEEMTSNT